MNVSYMWAVLVQKGYYSFLDLLHNFHVMFKVIKYDRKGKISFSFLASITVNHDRGGYMNLSILSKLHYIYLIQF